MIKTINRILKLDWYTHAAVGCLAIIIVVGLTSNYIATSKPLYLNNGGRIYFPAFSAKKTYKIVESTGKIELLYIENINWKTLYRSKKVFAPIPYDAGKSDINNAPYKPPFSKTICKDINNTEDVQCKLPFRHWLGTNLKGEDLLSGLIHGTSVSLKIGFIAILIAVIIGVLIGLLAGYFKNDTLKIPLLSFVFILLSIIPILFYAHLICFYVVAYLKLENIGLMITTILIYLLTSLLLIFIGYWLGKLLHKILSWSKKIYVPIDIIISRIIEIFSAIPKLMLVIALAATMDRSVNNVILIIAIISWSDIARLVRGETLKLRNQDFIVSAKALGLTHFKIMYSHLLPNISGPIMVTFVFGLSNSILIEAGLSFLNIGVPENIITWGQLLADGRNNLSAWWMIVFPGFAIFITTLCLNIIGEKFKSIGDINK